ncbi:unnamed protein product [Acanthoscelides obtectus]|uniref:Uncharacterized protein n=1 Tax=Acanthoscelides obtectus TaxID=200917 RepID=A0A9P0JJ22_ACAOB|nr:unnamed protein product [Acanthoscelides obtectus]CAK1628896.1 hypothetical protein AOBTE_LOCUS5454 [Acanthoscelides obtectus]
MVSAKWLDNPPESRQLTILDSLSPIRRFPIRPTYVRRFRIRCQFEAKIHFQVQVLTQDTSRRESRGLSLAGIKEKRGKKGRRHCFLFENLNICIMSRRCCL